MVCRSHVRVVSSHQSGMGKSLYIQRLVEDCHAADERWKHQIVALHGPDVTHDQVVKLLLKAESQDQMHTLCHLDISQNVSLDPFSAPTVCNNRSLFYHTDY